MSSATTYTCDKCRHRSSLDKVLRIYEGGAKLSVPTNPCWCHNCKDVTWAERVPDPEEIRSELSAWSAGNLEYGYLFVGAPYRKNPRAEAEVPAYLQSLLAWRLKRQSPSKCFTCGSSRIFLASSPYESLRHPACGGALKPLTSICASIGKRKVFIYSPEGLKISEFEAIA